MARGEERIHGSWRGALTWLVVRSAYIALSEEHEMPGLGFSEVGLDESLDAPRAVPGQRQPELPEERGDHFFGLHRAAPEVAQNGAEQDRAVEGDPCLGLAPFAMEHTVDGPNGRVEFSETWTI
jgi:hypothetical protein